VSDEYRIRKHRGKLSLVHNDPDRGRVRIALGTDDRGLAEARARELWRAKHRPPSERVADLWAAYVKDRLQTVARKDRFDSLWKALDPHFGHRLGSAVNADDCRAYYKARRKAGKSNSTVKTELEFLRACLRMRYGPNAPRLWMPPESAPRDRYLTPSERDQLLDSIAAPHARLFVILALTTGARMSALLDMKWSQVDFEHGTIDLNPAGREKTNKRRAVVPINSRARVALEEAKQGAETDHVIEYAGAPIKSIRKAIRQAAARSGIPCSPHVFRHTAGVMMAQADVPMQKIAQYLGHTSTRVTERVYARYSPSFMRDASAALDW
jgi:integrase